MFNSRMIKITRLSTLTIGLFAVMIVVSACDEPVKSELEEREFQIQQMKFEPTSNDMPEEERVSFHEFTIILKNNGILPPSRLVNTSRDLIVALDDEGLLMNHSRDERELFDAIYEANLPEEAQGKACVSLYDPSIGEVGVCLDCPKWYACKLSYYFIPDGC